jgi:hypothetical protein
MVAKLAAKPLRRSHATQQIQDQIHGDRDAGDRGDNGLDDKPGAFLPGAFRPGEFVGLEIPAGLLHLEADLVYLATPSRLRGRCCDRHRIAERQDKQGGLGLG